jgi:hypothetical protein
MAASVNSLSSSVSVEQAEVLMQSMVEVLRHGTDLPLTQIDADQYETVYQAGFSRIAMTVQTVISVYEQLQDSLPPIRSLSMMVSLNSFEQSWKYYMPERNAMEYPCVVDYQLACSVDASLNGADYALCYLKGMRLENRFLRRFETSKMTSLLNVYCRGWQSLPINLYEPVAVNALGRAAAGVSAFDLKVTKSNLQKITQTVSDLTEQEVCNDLIHAADVLQEELHLDQDEHKYLKQICIPLAARIHSVRDFGSLNHIFLTF